MSTPRVRDVTSARVLKGDRLAGRLTRLPTGDDVAFTYDQEYVADVGRPVAFTLPLTTQPVTTRGGAVPAFFAGLLPEGRRFDALVAAVKTSPDDELSLLLAVGQDCIGDVRILAEADDVPDLGSPVNLTLPHEVCFHDVFEQALDPFAVGGAEALPGVQDKISTAMLSLPVRTAGAQALLKLTPRGLPRLVENEAFFMTMAAACGLTVARTDILTDRDGHTGLLVERFDRRVTPEGLERIPQEDAVQLAGRWPASKYRMSTREVFDATLATTPAKIALAPNLLRLFAFSYLIGNGDLHGKNVSAYGADPDLWQITPAYDLLSTLPYGDRRMALQLDGHDDNLRGSAFVGFGERVGVRERVTRRLLTDLTDRAEPLLNGVERIGLDDRRTADLLAVMHKRLADLRVT